MKNKVAKKVINDPPVTEVVDRFTDAPLTDEAVIEIIHKGNLTDRQVKRIISVIKKKMWGKIAPEYIVEKLVQNKQV